MIKILSYKEHPRGKIIFDRYLYLAAYVLPFSPEDILGDDVIEVEGEMLSASDFYEKSKKSPRRRTEEYKKLLREHGIADTEPSSSLRLEQDRLLAAKLIWNSSRRLYTFLYQSEDTEQEPERLPLMKRENLRKLLTVKMDELDTELKEIGKIEGNAGKTLLKDVFRYEAFSQNPNAAELLADMDVNVCPYCNRLYTVTLKGKEGKSRPQFDHYKNKASYPHFAVSIMNLIPSCGLCNQTKMDREEEVLYPYSDEMGENAVFRTEIETGVSYLVGNMEAMDEFRVILDIVNPDLPEKLREKINHSDNVFHLTSLYNKHKDYILYLFWKNYVFSEAYLELLCEEFPGVFRSFQDAKSMMYLMDIEKEQWGRRSLGKLTHDIDMEINRGD